MKFRQLTADNAFDFCAVLDAVGINQVISIFDKEEITAIMKNQKNRKAIGKLIAMKLSGILLKNMSSARKEIYRFLANCLMQDDESIPVTEDDLRKLPLAEFAKLLKAFSDNQDLHDFFTEVSAFVSTEQTNSENSAIGDIPDSVNILQAPSDSPDSRPHVLRF